VDYLKVIAFTHKHTDLKDLGKLIISDDLLETRLQTIKAKFDILEICYISTCNRVEFVFTTSEVVDHVYVTNFIRSFDFAIPEERLEEFSKQASIYENVEAFNHLLRVSCSLESLVVGEKEIFAQVRKSYEMCREVGCTGDYLRVVMNHVVKTAKEVYTLTNIARKPISVVSLAYRKLKELHMPANARILIIGAGETNKNLSKYLQKQTFSNFAIFNRTRAKAELLAKELNAEVFGLEDLKNYKRGFDIIITCTGATQPIITEEVYQSLLNGESGSKVIVDLAVPNDTCQKVLANNPIYFIGVNSLQEVAKRNLRERHHELIHAERIIDQNIQKFKPILKRREIERAMSEVPEKIKEIKKLAMDSIFAEDIQTLDDSSREVLRKVVNYMEKKYISIPMVMAKEILAKNS